jgi:hypothetical protein
MIVQRLQVGSYLVSVSTVNATALLGRVTHNEGPDRA